MPTEEILERLKQMGNKLNAATDSLNEEFEKVEAKLQELKIGIPVWSDVVITDSYNGLSKDDNGYRFGYQKCTTGWKIVVQKLNDENSQLIPITTASRAIRIATTPHIDNLLCVLMNEAIAMAKKIDHAISIIKPNETTQTKKENKNGAKRTTPKETNQS